MQPIKVLCSDCRIKSWCIASGLNETQLKEVESIVKQPRPVQKSQRLYSSGEPFNSVYVVRSGCIKTYATAINGDQQIINFTLPGDLLGIDGISENHYYRTAEALETSSVCELPFEKLETLAGRIKTMQHQLNRSISEEFVADQQILLQLGKMSAEQKIAAFLVSISNKFHARGLSATEFYLPMTRTDIANYLGMAVETVSRQIVGLRYLGIIKATRKHIKIYDMERLRHIANFGDHSANPIKQINPLNQMAASTG